MKRQFMDAWNEWKDACMHGMETRSMDVWDEKTCMEWKDDAWVH